MIDNNILLLLQVLQYKKRCGDLEQMLQEKSSELDKHRLSVRDVYRFLTLSKPPFVHTIINFYIFSFRVTVKHQMVAIKTNQAATWKML